MREPGDSRQRPTIVRTSFRADIEAPPAALAFRERLPIERRSLEQRSHRVCDRDEQIQILLAIGLFRLARAEHEQRQRRGAGDISRNRHEQLDALLEQQCTLVERKLMSHRRRVAE